MATAAALGLLIVPATSKPAEASAQAPSITTRADFTGHGSIGEAYELGARPGQKLVVADGAGRIVGRGVADRLGSLIVPNLAPGPGYTFRSVEGAVVAGTPAFRVLSVHDTPPASFYADQHLHVGLNYLTMRDGITLAATVRLPPGKTLADGPFPTVIEDSGYAIAAPGNLIDALLSPSSAAASNPLLPDTATVVGSVIAPLLGFATISLQMRGSGCSGGAYDLFGLPTTYDGYDAVQIAAAQPWVKGHKVGMVGISYSGISQLFVAGTRPPGLAAIAPLSVTNDLYATGYPGGIFNSGFAGSWIAQRVADAKPAPAGGQAYARALIAQGDKQCLANQRLRLQTEDLSTLEAQNSHRTPSLFDVRSPQAWAAHIDVPVFLVGALQDEQTGPQWPAIIPALRGDKHVWVSMLNGTHIDSLGPATITRWIEFLDLFVADEIPHAPSLLTSLSGALYQRVAGTKSEPLPVLRFTTAKSPAQARVEFIAQDPRVRVLFDNGGSAAAPGSMDPLWEADFSAWPPPRAVATTLGLGPSGRLGTVPRSASSVSFEPDPAARPATSLAPGANAWAALPPYNWTPVTGRLGVGFISAALGRNVVMVGPASLNLWLRSSARDTDLQVTVSDVRSDGQEMYVTSGFLRASDRALSPASSALAPQPTYLASQARPLPPGQWSLVRIPIDPVGYAFRTGSRIRITISAPGGDRPAWAFATYPTAGAVTDTISLGGAHPSALVVPVVAGVAPSDPQPPCPSSRGEPCRSYVPAGNGG